MRTSSPDFRPSPSCTISHRLGCVPGDGHLFGIAAERTGQPPSHDLDPRTEHLVDVIRRAHVDDVPVLVHRRLHGPGSGADASAVEVDGVPVDGERLADPEPEVLVLRRFLRRSPSGVPGARERFARERGEPASGRSEKCAATLVHCVTEGGTPVRGLPELFHASYRMRSVFTGLAFSSRLDVLVGHADVGVVISVVVGAARGIVLLRDGDISHVSCLPLARSGGLGLLFAGAAFVAAGRVGAFHRRHHAVGEGARRFGESKRGLVGDGVAEQDVALNLKEDVLADLARNEERCRVVLLPVESGRPSLKIQDAELAALHLRLRFPVLVLAQELDDSRRLGALFQFFIDDLLVLARVVDTRLASGDPHTGNDDRLDIHQIARGSWRKAGLRDAGRRSDDDLAGAPIDGDDRPGREAKEWIRENAHKSEGEPVRHRLASGDRGGFWVRKHRNTSGILATAPQTRCPRKGTIELAVLLYYYHHVITISITVDEPLLKDIDRVAKDSKRTRSDICRLALRKWLRSERQAVLVREEQEAYRVQPVTSDEFEDLMNAQTIHDVRRARGRLS